MHIDTSSNIDSDTFHVEFFFFFFPSFFYILGIE